MWDRSSQIMTEDGDREQEEYHIRTALTRCGYPDWSINQVKSQMLIPKTKKTTRKRIRQLSDEPKSTVVIPYVQDLSESVSRVYKRHDIPTAMRPFQSMRSLLVHPKDKHRPQDICECVYKIPCKNCNKTYIGETGRAFGVRLQKHRQEVSQRDVKAYTRSTSRSLAGEQNKSAVTDHIDVINVYNVYKKFFVNAFINLSTFISIKIT